MFRCRHDNIIKRQENKIFRPKEMQPKTGLFDLQNAVY